jgi:hypothetical protein
VFGTILTRRTIYHMATYGEQIDPYSNAFRQTVARLQGHAFRAAGEGAAAARAATAQIGSFVSNEAFIRAIDDVFLIAGIVVVIGVIPMIFLKTHRVPSVRRRTGAKPVQAHME